MHPKIDKVLHLVDDQTVDVQGPPGDWDPEYVAVVFAAVVSQATGTNSAVTSIGWSQKYKAAADFPGNPPRWHATVKVLQGGKAFQAAGATVAAWAIYADRDGGSWVYEWRLPVMLTDRPADEPSEAG